MDPDRTDIHTGLDLFLPGEKSTQGPRYARIEDKVWKSLKKNLILHENYEFWFLTFIDDFLPFLCIEDNVEKT